MRLAPLILIPVLVIAAVGYTLADETPAMPDAGTPVMPQLSPLALDLDEGQWREYYYIGGPSDGASVRWTWLNKIERDGQEFQWFETRMKTAASADAEPGNPRVVVSKLLVNRSHPEAVPAVVIMQRDEQPPVTMPAAMRTRATEILKMSGAPPKETGSADVEVLAGKFSTTMYLAEQNGVTQRTYVSESLPGMVLLETPGFRLELAAMGDDGRSMINEPKDD